MFTLTFDEVREDDGYDLGDILGFDLHGHLDHEQVDDFLNRVLPDEGYCENDSWVGDFDATLCWRSQSVANDDDGEELDYLTYLYSDNPASGGIPVTRLVMHQPWGFWCHNHPFEPAATGIPSMLVVGGEQVMAAAALHASEPEASESRVTCTLPSGSRSGYIYFCEECRDTHAVAAL